MLPIPNSPPIPIHEIFNSTSPFISTSNIVTVSTYTSIFDVPVNQLLPGIPSWMIPFMIFLLPLAIVINTQRFRMLPFFISFEGVIFGTLQIIPFWMELLMILFTPIYLGLIIFIEPFHDEYGNIELGRRTYGQSYYDKHEQDSIQNELLDMYSYFKEMK